MSPWNALNHDAARWRALLETLLDAIVCIDAGGRITVFNPAAEAMFGYSAGEVLGEKVDLLMPAPYRAEHDGYLDAHRRTGVRKKKEYLRRSEKPGVNFKVFKRSSHCAGRWAAM